MASLEGGADSDQIRERFDSGWVVCPGDSKVQGGRSLRCADFTILRSQPFPQSYSSNRKQPLEMSSQIAAQRVDLELRRLMPAEIGYGIDSSLPRRWRPCITRYLIVNLQNV